MCICNLRLKSKTKGNEVRHRSSSVSAPRPHGNCDLRGDWRKSCVRSGATGQVSFPGALENDRALHGPGCVTRAHGYQMGTQGQPRGLELRARETLRRTGLSAPGIWVLRRGDRRWDVLS